MFMRAALFAVLSTRGYRTGGEEGRRLEFILVEPWLFGEELSERLLGPVVWPASLEYCPPMFFGSLTTNSAIG